MSATTDSEFDFKKIIAWALVIALGSVVFVVAMISIANMAKGTKPIDPEAVSLRIAPVAALKIAAPVTVGGAARSGEQIYKAVCGACHEAGVAGARKIGDRGAGGARIKAGPGGMM